jgi:hypothetical protein
MSGNPPARRHAPARQAEGHTTMEAPSASSFLVLGGVDMGPLSSEEHRSNNNNQMELPSEQDYEERVKDIPFIMSDDIPESGEFLFIDPVDTPVPTALDDSVMKESQRLQAELEGIEARIAELSKDELGAYERLTEVQRETDDLRTARVALEEAANVIRQCLGRPAASIVVRLATSQPKPTAVPRRRIRDGTRIDRFLAVLEPLMTLNGGSATRQVIKQTWLEAGLFEGMENIESTLDGLSQPLQERRLHHDRISRKLEMDRY